ncbi:MAG: ORF6N domain-containing protein [Erysipelotrichaceae bacterium]|nr:ORF6N domain-containing protein [Erysipelotrichaceae bacterium]
MGKFDEDFRFQLTRQEVEDLVRSKNLTSRNSSFFQGQSGGSRYLPYVFTEQGIYMLKVLKDADPGRIFPFLRK